MTTPNASTTKTTNHHRSTTAVAIAKVMELNRRKVDRAELEHAAANRATTLAQEARLAAEEAWHAAVDSPHGIEVVGTSADLEASDLHCRSLRRAMDEAERRVHVARAHEFTTRQMMTAARIELRRYETWLERDAEAHAAESRRVSRIAEDETASSRYRRAR